MVKGTKMIEEIEISGEILRTYYKFLIDEYNKEIADALFERARLTDDELTVLNEENRVIAKGITKTITKLHMF